MFGYDIQGRRESMQFVRVEGPVRVGKGKWQLVCVEIQEFLALSKGKTGMKRSIGR